MRYATKTCRQNLQNKAKRFANQLLSDVITLACVSCRFLLAERNGYQRRKEEEEELHWSFVNCLSLRKAVKRECCKKHSAQNVTFQWRLMDGPCLKGPWAKSRVRFFSFQSFTIMAERVAWNDKISIEDRSWRSINFALGGPYSTCVSSHKYVSTRLTQLAWKNIHGM